MTIVTVPVFTPGLSPPVPDDGSRWGWPAVEIAPAVAPAAGDGFTPSAAATAALLSPAAPTFPGAAALTAAPSLVPRKPDSTEPALTRVPADTRDAARLRSRAGVKLGSMRAASSK